ncbi:LPXTG-motif cell wall anchor domain protein [Gleimia coleocanis DSM 15436]|uniref:LPXTG-motif cell wall anchor domain protein n=1 Tax=Gleimia coleocanis DSM 15436 TaxID=525245 RepID=C0VZM5_9ACTO|nr:hypothetical protein [Gleimia coleocanis]EEH64144.1 LPXTG-motif cell wall anchor domain protein [Gleimia coleocanis DSM 15436]
MTRGSFAAKALTLLAATAVSTMVVVPAMAGENIDAPTTIITVGDANIQCSAEATYNLNFSGHMDMTKVVAKWKEMKAIPDGYGQGARFNNLNVWAEAHPESPAGTKFSMSFKIDHPELVTVNNAILTNHDAWTAAYKAANNNHSFTDSMIVDRTAVPTYDQATGVVVVPMTLVDGLKAEKLNTDFITNNLQALDVRTPEGLITMSRAQMIQALKTNVTTIHGTDAKVIGAINVQKPVFNNFLANALIGSMWPEYFPMTFGQATPAPAAFTLSADYFGIPNVDVKGLGGKPVAPEVEEKAVEVLTAATANADAPKLELNIADMTITNLADLPAISAEPVAVPGGNLVFTGWRPVAGELVWETEDSAPYCVTAPIFAQFDFIPEAVVENPEFTLPTQCDGDVTVKLPAEGKGLTYEKTVNADKSVTVVGKLVAGWTLPKGTTEADLVWKSDTPKKCDTPVPPKKPETPKNPETPKKPLAPKKPEAPKKLANTGATVLVAGGAAALSLLAGSALVVMRRRNG